MPKAYLEEQKILVSNSGLKTAIKVFAWISLIGLIIGVAYAIYDAIINLLVFLGFGLFFSWFGFEFFLIPSIIWGFIRLALGITALILFLPVFKDIRNKRYPKPGFKLWIATILAVFTYYGAAMIVLIILLYVATSD